LFIYLHIY